MCNRGNTFSGNNRRLRAALDYSSEALVVSPGLSDLPPKNRRSRFAGRSRIVYRLLFCPLEAHRPLYQKLPGLFGDALIKAGAIAAVLYEVSNTLTKAAGTQGIPFIEEFTNHAPHFDLFDWLQHFFRTYEEMSLKTNATQMFILEA
ncbi:hypothetical protein E3N88_23163 [Mikania micrantha]|uniref:Uncharacterized protein n=1 Tax=Mikania micrantha TaxID=192012 RepID=A0A5N6NCJ2_9ASTR|nr:hypothetical protein E3N88_23163 [Mikania micrantha]